MNIYEFALALEIRAETTYLDCAKKTDNSALKTVFNLLATGERNHQKIIRELERKNPVEVSVSTLLGESRSLLETLVPDKAALRAAGSQADVYRQARAQEEAAETFYREKAAESTNSQSREILTALAAQEHDHFMVLDWLVELVGHPEATLENAEFFRH